jgi:hypothetical protein
VIETLRDPSIVKAEIAGRQSGPVGIAGGIILMFRSKESDGEQTALKFRI